MTGFAAGRHRHSRISSALTLAVGADAALHSAFHGAPGPSHALAQLFTVAAHLAAHGGDLDEDGLVAELLGEGWDELEGVPETGTQRVLTAIADGRDWWRAARGHGDGRAGCGGDVAVRACAAGLVPGAELGIVAQLARRSAMVTHAHPDVLDAVAVQACAVALALAEADFGTVDADKFLGVLSGQCRRAGMRRLLTAAGVLCRHETSAAQAAAILGAEPGAVAAQEVVAAPEAVAVALAGFLRHPLQPLRAIEWVRGMGARWHPAAVMTAVIGGAANPHARPSIVWQPVTARRAHIAAAATGLAGVTPARARRTLRTGTNGVCH